MGDVEIKYNSLIDPILERAVRDPDRLAMVFIAEDGSRELITNAKMHEDAAAYAQALQAIGIKKGDLVILVLRHQRELISAFWGAMYLGAIPSIFPYLTEKLDATIYKERVRALVGYFNARAVITFQEYKDDMSVLLSGMKCPVIGINEVVAYEPESSWEPVDFSSGEELACLLLSSGTTGLQKGIAHSHRATLGQLEVFVQALQVRAGDVAVGWVPLYHDMGMVLSLFLPTYAGIPTVIMSPFSWVRNPKMLFWAIHEFKGTLSWMPNFAFNLCVRSIREQDLEGLDLSHWRVLINSAEPIRYDSHMMFIQRFAPYGFRESALTPTYGMTEITGIATITPLDQSPTIDWVNRHELQEARIAVPANPHEKEAMPLVSSGVPTPKAEVIIMTEDGKRLPDRQVGEIVLRSEFVIDEYYHRPDLTSQVMRDGWYYTGDLGYLTDGHLFVTGRKSDLIIIGGHNIHPEDIEEIANKVPGVYPGRAAAFGVTDEYIGSEVIVLVCELRHQADDKKKLEIERELRYRVVQELGVTLTHILLIEEKGWIIKTSNGKIARAANRGKYLRLKEH